MCRFAMGLMAVALASGLVGASEQLKPIKEFRGSHEDEKLGQQGPAGHVIASKAVLEKLWKAWGVKEEMPDVDFTKELVLVATSRGSRIQVNATLNAGDLKVSAFGTKDLRPGFRYHIVVVKCEGVKTVNGKPLPRE